MLDHGQRAYRAGQVRRWLFEKRASSWEQMTDLPRELREQLAAEFAIWSAEIAVRRKSEDGTEKLLLTLADGRQGHLLPSPSGRGAGGEGGDLISPHASALREGEGTKGPSQIECVLLRDDKGHCSICISTQVGCAMNALSAPWAWAA